MLRDYPSNSSVLESLSLRFITGSVEHGDVVEEVLKELFSLLSHIEYECLVVDSTEVTDWFMGFMSYSLNVSGQHAISSTRQANSSELKFTNGYLKGLCLVMGIRR